MFTEERIGEILRQLSLLRYPETVPANRLEKRARPANSAHPFRGLLWLEYNSRGRHLGRRLRILRLRRRPHAPGDLRGGIRRSSRCSPAARGSGMRRIRQFSVYINGELRRFRCQPSRAHAHRVCKDRRVLFCFPFRLYRRAELSSGI